MKSIDLQGLIDERQLDKKSLATSLFPSNKYPQLALNRVLKSESVLDENQISRLALFCGISIEELYSGSGWKTSSKNNKHVFSNGDYRAELDTDTWITRVFHKNSMFHESIIHSGSIQLSKYIEQLNILIKQNESSED